MNTMAVDTMLDIGDTTLLILPSTEDAHRVYTLLGLTYEEAERFVNDFQVQIRATRRNVRVLDKDEGVFTQFIGMMPDEGDIDSDYLTQVAELIQCNVRGTRGRRALFIDTRNNVVATGTMIVYNANHATQGFIDPTVVKTLEEAKDSIEVY